MSTQTPYEFYAAQRERFARSAARAEHSIRRIALLRLASAAWILVSGCCWVYSVRIVPRDVWLYAVIVGMVAFAWFVTWHKRLFVQKEYAEQLLAVNEEELRVLQGNMSGIPDGNEYLRDQTFAPPNTEAYALDLDIFGEYSLFQRINRTVTPLGSRTLAAWLVQPLASISAIKERQKLLAELSQRTEFRQEWRAAAGKTTLSAAEQEALHMWLHQDNTFRASVLMRLVLWVLPAVVLGVLCAVAVVMQIDHPAAAMLQKVLGIGVLMQLTITGFAARRIMREYAYTNHFARVLTVYVRLLRVVQIHAQKQTFLQEQLKTLASCTDAALEAMSLS